MIFGVAGLNGSGKGAVIEFLRSGSFEVFSLSDVIRRSLNQKGVEETRVRMIAEGRLLREEGGPSALADLALARIQLDRNYAIDSVRHPAEAQALRESGQPFKLLWIEAPNETRLERIVTRGRPGDPTTLGELEQLRDFGLVVAIRPIT